MTIKSSCLMTWSYAFTMAGTTSRGGDGKLILLKKPVSVRIVGCNSPEVRSLVIADQHAAVDTFPGLVRTAVTPRVCNTQEVGEVTFWSQPPKDWDR